MPETSESIVRFLQRVPVDQSLGPVLPVLYLNEIFLKVFGAVQNQTGCLGSWIPSTTTWEKKLLA